jgi:hypothetical protein
MRSYLFGALIAAAALLCSPAVAAAAPVGIGLHQTSPTDTPADIVTSTTSESIAIRRVASGHTSQDFSAAPRLLTSTRTFAVAEPLAVGAICGTG